VRDVSTRSRDLVDSIKGRARGLGAGCGLAKGCGSSPEPCGRPFALGLVGEVRESASLALGVMPLVIEAAAGE
jgi:hypothetical protein